MNICFKFKPYAVSIDENVENIENFDNEEEDLIYDVFVRIVRNFKQVYTNVDVQIKKINNLVDIRIEADKITEDEFEYFVDILTGHQEDSIVFFDDLVKDLTPELMNTT